MEKRFSLIANNSPSSQAISPHKLNAYKWLESRRADDNAEGLWRVHNGLYDLTDFIKWHPGGPDWIQLTKGTDITEAFEVHHIKRGKVESILQEYRVRDAKLPRNFKFTFKETGFYRTVHRRVAEKLKTISTKRGEFTSKVFIDALLFLTLLTAILSVKYSNQWFMLLSSLCMCYTIISAHNFFHRRDNFRMMYFNLSFLNYKEWRISHAMSHHLFPNSLYDLEIVLFEPILCWIPSPMKTFTQRYFSWLYSPIVYTFLFLDQLFKRIVFSIASKKNRFETSDAIPLIVPFAMHLCGDANLFHVLTVWLQIILTSSFIFGWIGLNAGHHHPDIVHEGDKVREDLDWGIYTLDTIMDNSFLRKHHFLALTHFGHHALHHLFPTLDHGVLSQLYPILFQTMDEFEVELGAYPWYHHVSGQFRQLSRIQPNPIDSLEKLRRKKIQQKME